jgi:hypothetical protein
MQRRAFLKLAAGSAACGAAGLLASRFLAAGPQLEDAFAPVPPAFSIIPVVGDGKYIWNEPPDGQTGYLEPRPYQLRLGIELEGTGNATQIKATTVAPVEHPEQKLEAVGVDGVGCSAALRALTPEAGQLVLAAPGIAKGQKIAAAATYKLTLHKEYHAYVRERFPAAQKFSKESSKQYLYDSPGIQMRSKEVRELVKSVGGQIEHPWDRAKAYHAWVWENIRVRIGSYTSVVEALRDRVGDCEERAAVFVALCRASGIPARLVWVPNHNWAEFYLNDEQGEGHWIAAHTSAYSWFGWTGAHELVLQKGDNIVVPEKKQELRLLADWMQWLGAKPEVRYYAELAPLPPEPGADPGPGARSKDAKGE